MLWTAPELIRSDDRVGTKAGDIYSFAIICSEILTRRSAWNITERTETIEGNINSIDYTTSGILCFKLKKFAHYFVLMIMQIL